MSSERGRVVLIFLAVAILAGASGFYFFKIYRPKQVKQGAQDEITAWETRFTAARDCLLGKTPGSSKTSEALAIREMAPDPWDRGRCTPLISKLSRGEAPDTGLADVEHAWEDLDHAATKAATAFATHVGSSTTLKQDPLPAALDNLDAARAKLRDVAGLPAVAQRGGPLPAATLLPLKALDDPLVEVTVDTVPSAHGMVVFGRTNEHVQVMLTSGGAGKVSRVGDGNVLRGVPDPWWGAGVVGPDVQIGKMGPDSTITGATSEKLPDATVAAVLGSLDAGEVVYGNRDGLVIAHAKAGEISVDPMIKIVTGQAALDSDGRAALVWKDAAGKTFGRILKPGADEPTVELDATGVGPTCLTNDRAWTISGEKVIGFGGGKPTVTRTRDGAIAVGCTGDAILLRPYDPKQPLKICADECRNAAMPAGAPQFSATTVVAGKLVAVAAHSGVLGVWREGAAPLFYALGDDAAPVLAHEWPAMVMTDGKVLDVLSRGSKSFDIVRVPAN